MKDWTSKYSRLRDFEDGFMDTVSPGWRHVGVRPNPKVSTKVQKAGDGFSHKIHVDGKQVGHIAGFDSGYFDTSKTIIDESARGQFVYQTALAQVALLYPEGTRSRRYQMSTEIKKAIRKIPGIVFNEEKDAWYLSQDAAKAFLAMVRKAYRSLFTTLCWMVATTRIGMIFA